VDNVLEARNLRKEYAGFALKEVSLTIPRGYILGLIGPNGAGKTTTIRMLMNMVKPSAGEIRVFGMDPAENEKAVKDRIGFVGTSSSITRTGASAGRRSSSRDFSIDGTATFSGVFSAVSGWSGARG